ncbi:MULTISPECIES: hypothetical protein [Mesorhizobium]|uniref:hypothetical protein n=1 Tax=Mesorhizobium TaxID=68287 RepID=UPI001140FC62|nr:MULTISPECIES: hypothetical protein [Mesorhizobium]
MRFPKYAGRLCWEMSWGLADYVEFADFFRKAIFMMAAYIELLRRFIQADILGQPSRTNLGTETLA